MLVPNLIKKTRICTRCKVEKKFNEMMKDNNRTFNIGFYCKECAKTRARDGARRRRKNKLLSINKIL